MNFLMKADRSKFNDTTEYTVSWDNYYRYLESVRNKLPEETYEFAVADWHYSSTDHRSLHDSWVESFKIEECAKLNSLSISIDLLGPYHDMQIHLRYFNVTSYSLNKLHSDIPKHINKTYGHSDWLIDEISLSNEDKVIHDICFRSGAKWRIECDLIRCNHSPQK